MRFLTRSPALRPGSRPPAGVLARPAAGTRRTALGCALATSLVPALLLSATPVSAKGHPFRGAAHHIHGAQPSGQVPVHSRSSHGSVAPAAVAACPGSHRAPDGGPAAGPGGAGVGRGGGAGVGRALPGEAVRPPCGGGAAKGEVRIRAADGTSGDPLPGAVFELWQDTNGVPGLQPTGTSPDLRLGARCTTGADGVCARTVRPGTYYWRETTAPAGYDLPSPAVFGPALLTGDNAGGGVQLSAPGTVTPDPVTGTLRLQDTDAYSGLPVRGARFELWRETNRVAGPQTDGAEPDTRLGPGCVTDAAGGCAFPDLAPGSYYLRETGVPEGYRLPAQPVTGPHVLMAHEAAQDVTVRLHDSRDARGKAAHPGRRGQ